MRNLLDVLKRKQLNAPFLCLLESLNYTSLLESLSTDRQPIQYLCRYFYCFIICFLIHACMNYTFLIKHRTFAAEYAVCIQRSFTTLQIELQEAILPTMEHVLTESDVSDIDHCSNRFRKISKLMKILISKGDMSCKELFGAIAWRDKRKDLIEKMITRSDYLVRRGKSIMFWYQNLAFFKSNTCVELRLNTCPPAKHITKKATNRFDMLKKGYWEIMS